jgi:hypothetical protein
MAKIAELEEELKQYRIIDNLALSQKDMPEEFAKIVEENFWQLCGDGEEPSAKENLREIAPYYLYKGGVMKVELINVGSFKVCKVFNAKNEKDIFKEIKKHIFSKDFEIVKVEGEDEDTYTICVGIFRPVGKIKITMEE